MLIRRIDDLPKLSAAETCSTTGRTDFTLAFPEHITTSSFLILVLFYIAVSDPFCKRDRKPPPCLTVGFTSSFRTDKNECPVDVEIDVFSIISRI